MDLRTDLMKVVYPFGSVKTKAEVPFKLRGSYAHARVPE